MLWKEICDPWVGSPATQVRLPGGLINDVYRISGPLGSLILKSAPAFIASAPELPLSPRRLAVENAALKIAKDFNTESVQVPNVLHFDESASVLLTEDLGDGPTLRKSNNLMQDLSELAAWLKRLHHSTQDLPELPDFGVHSVRKTNQYVPLSEQIKYSNGAFSKELIWAADYFQTEPKSLIMGDLWMPSVLKRNKLFVIDWEFSAHGHPEQDVGHLAAHLFLSYGSALESHFLNAYQVGAWNEGQHRAFRAHRGAELLQRTIGAFPGTGGASAKSPAQMRAVAERWLVSSGRHNEV
jgi:5-methylthioribose kinase